MLARAFGKQQQPLDVAPELRDVAASPLHENLQRRLDRSSGPLLDLLPDLAGDGAPRLAALVIVAALESRERRHHRALDQALREPARLGRHRSRRTRASSDSDRTLEILLERGRVGRALRRRRPSSLTSSSAAFAAALGFEHPLGAHDDDDAAVAKHREHPRGGCDVDRRARQPLRHRTDRRQTAGRPDRSSLRSRRRRRSIARTSSPTSR